MMGTHWISPRELCRRLVPISYFYGTYDGEANLYRTYEYSGIYRGSGNFLSAHTLYTTS